MPKADGLRRKIVNGVGDTTTLHGSFEPYRCTRDRCEGYVQAGARSVFVRFPDGCPPPARASQVTIRARAARDLGSAAYRALGCPCTRRATIEGCGERSRVPAIVTVVAASSMRARSS